MKKFMEPLRERERERERESSSNAFALPTLVITATILMITAVSVAQTAVSISTTLRSNSYNHLADEAARAGVAYAYSCLKQNGTNYWTNQLKPNTDCAGSGNSASAYIEDKTASGDSPHYRSSFTVSVPDDDNHATVQGTVELVDSSSTVTKTWVSDKVVVINIGGSETNGSVASIVAGSYHTCALTTSNQVYCWGRNDSGELGNNSTTDSSTPVKVSTTSGLGDKAIEALTAGDAHTCAVANSQAYCWGDNREGELGTNSTTDSHVPVAVYTSGVLSGKAVTAISAGMWYTCALANSQAYCWGGDESGKLGNGSPSANSSVPVAVYTGGALSGKTVTAISAESEHACVVANDQAYCWAHNSYGALGNGTTTYSPVPVAVYTSGVLNGKTVTAVSSGNWHTCAIADGKAYCWGRNSNGQLGNGTTTDSSVPVAVNASGVLSGKTVTAITASGFHTCAIADGKAYCWGSNYQGQLGNNSTTDSSVPVAVNTSGVLSGKTVTAITSEGRVGVGGGHTCVIADGAAYCWGQNSNGDLGNGSTANSYVPVAVSPFN